MRKCGVGASSPHPLVCTETCSLMPGACSSVGPESCRCPQVVICSSQKYFLSIYWDPVTVLVLGPWRGQIRRRPAPGESGRLLLQT